MGIEIKPSDLQYKYWRKKATREVPKFTGKPDKNPFDRDDLYEVIPMFEAVMDALGTDSGEVLNRLEEMLENEVPRFINSREEVYDCLFSSMSGVLSWVVGE